MSSVYPFSEFLDSDDNARGSHITITVVCPISDVQLKIPRKLFKLPVNSSVSVNSLENFKIIWLSNILTLSVLNEGYSRNASCALIQISTCLCTLNNKCIYYLNLSIAITYPPKRTLQTLLVYRTFVVQWSSYKQCLPFN